MKGIEANNEEEEREEEDCDMSLTVKTYFLS